MRIDLLLCRLRFAKSRSVAQRWIAEGHMRCNGARVTRSGLTVAAGDVLTLPMGQSVKVIAVDMLPERRGPASEARLHYRELDAGNPFAIGPADQQKGLSPP
ncbi:MAG: RNA-binding S4 domain-containing protein [Erythrobacter sp.]|nr:MAG: RNA-binding S4 domain-containing protein [Erythrobacter sp.]